MRDWSYPYDHEFGEKGGRKYLDKVLEASDAVCGSTSGVSPPQVKEGQHEEIKIVREHIRRCFDRVFSFLLPHPGLKVATNPQFDGRLSGIISLERGREGRREGESECVRLKVEGMLQLSLSVWQTLTPASRRTWLSWYLSWCLGMASWSRRSTAIPSLAVDCSTASGFVLVCVCVCVCVYFCFSTFVYRCT